MKSSTFARSLELAKLAARVGLKEMRSGDLKSRLEQAALIAKSLSSLKGAAMKAGQLLSLDLNHYFPAEAIEILSQLQNAAVAQPFDQIEKILLSELGKKKLSGLCDLSKIPIGVASIGQVHRARYEDQEIVLKVQYAGVADSIDSDLRILKTMAVSFCQLTSRKMDLGPLFEEFRNLLEQEVDYQKEARLQKKYGSLVARMPQKSEPTFYRVPKIFDELSTARVIGMSFERGVSLRSWIQSNPTKIQRENLAIGILDLYFHEFFEWGLVQTDPNWANFLVDQVGSQMSLVILDFGATREYSRDFIKDYIRLLHLASEANLGALNEHAIEMGLIDRRESAAAFLAFAEMLKTAIRPFFSGHGDSAHFDFSDQRHSVNSQAAAKALAEELVYSPPPYNLVFLHRKLAGVYSILKTLGVELDVSAYWHKMTELSSPDLGALASL